MTLSSKARTAAASAGSLALFVALLIGCAHPAAAQPATPTPGGDCCTAHGGSNCDSDACSNCVCNTGPQPPATPHDPDPICCAASSSWDTTCVADAQRCGDVCACNQPPPPTFTPGGSCCDPHAGPSCDSGDCQACVCGEDPHCCGQDAHGTPVPCLEGSECWDATCVNEAQTDCTANCPCGTPPPPTPTPIPPPGGDCCTGHDAASCSDSTCVSCVCAEDPHCCGMDSHGMPITCDAVGPCWDDTCAQEAAIDCSDSCICPSPQDCCTVQADANNPVPGCNDESCKACVCHGDVNDSSCCDPNSGWDQDCVAEVSADCGPSCSCVSKAGCCDAHDPNSDQPAGCSDDTCQSCVCTFDPFCCDVVNGYWDDGCAQEAADPTLCQDRCTGCVDCCNAHDNPPNCSHTACSQAVCQGQINDSSCCDGTWDQQCADEAGGVAVCGCGSGSRGPTPTPPTGSCPGDCLGQNNVSISDLIVCVNIALGQAQVSSCPAADTNNDGMVTITDIIKAVNAALSGCPST